MSYDWTLVARAGLRYFVGYALVPAAVLFALLRSVTLMLVLGTVGTILVVFALSGGHRRSVEGISQGVDVMVGSRNADYSLSTSAMATDVKLLFVGLGLMFAGYGTVAVAYVYT